MLSVAPTVKSVSPKNNSLKTKSNKGKTQKKFVVVSKSSSTTSTNDITPKQIALEEEKDSMDDLLLSEVKKIMIERKKNEDITTNVNPTKMAKKLAQEQMNKPVAELIDESTSNPKGMSMRKERKPTTPFTLT